jgi:site-specific DNA-cytosine methylase
LRANAALCATDNMIYANKRLNETIKKHYDNLKHGTMIDSYNKSIHYDKSITISTRVNASSATHIVDKKEVSGCDYRSDEGIRIRENGKSGTLAARARNDESCGQLAKIDSHIRRLTPIECERLQTVKDNYTNHVSDSQRYKMLGNGWTVDVIAHIFSYLK